MLGAELLRHQLAKFTPVRVVSNIRQRFKRKLLVFQTAAIAVYADAAT
jgi:hypothetical protein